MLKISKAGASPTPFERESRAGWFGPLSPLVRVVLVAVTTTMGAQTFAQESEPKRIETQFNQGDESYPAYILLDRVAVVLTEEALETPGKFEEIVRQLGGKPIETLSRNIIGIDVSGAQTVGDLKKFIGTVLEERAAGLHEFIADTGVLVTVAASETPRVLTDRIIVWIDADRDPDFIKVILDEFDAELVRRNPFNPRSFVIRTLADNSLEVSNTINSQPGVRFAHPSFYIAGEFRQASVIPDDEFFEFQWHLLNSGQNNGTEDADIDADLAWSLGAGSRDILIAVIDSGFEIDHPDLADAIWANPGEIINDQDDDWNGYVDDVHGWDFTSCPNFHPNGDADHCGDRYVTPTESPKRAHGTAVAGGAVARAFNGGPSVSGQHQGVVGVCPNCQLLPLRFSPVSNPDETHELPIQYAQSKGARIINISWGYRRREVVPMSVKEALNDAAMAGAVIFVAMTNKIYENCDPDLPDVPDLSAHPKVIAVAGSTNEELVSPGGYGHCLSVLAPTDGGTLRTTTTDLEKSHGYNFAQQKPKWTCQGPEQSRSYTFCFGGLSFSAPLAAGVAGLVLSHDDSLGWEDVKRLLQDTADKASDSVAEYSIDTGYSAPASGEFKYGYGRLNAFEAVRVIADPFGGRGGVDIFVRDNRLDWGNTEQPSSITFEQYRGSIPYWQSVDVKIDAPPFRTSPPEDPEELSCLSSALAEARTEVSVVPPASSVEFGCFAGEDPAPGELNRIYVRAHNRGVTPATNVRVKLFWAAHAGIVAPNLPNDFWSAFAAHLDSNNTSTWHPLTTQTVASLPYSGASLAGSPQDASAVLALDFAAPDFDQTHPDADHLTMLAIINSRDDPVLPDSVLSQEPAHITPRDNNVTQLTIPLGASIAEITSQPFDLRPSRSERRLGNADYRRARWYFSQLK